MAKYEVVYNGPAPGTGNDERQIVEKFAAAYKISPEQARAKISGPGCVVYSVGDMQAAQKAKAFLESIGGGRENSRNRTSSRSGRGRSRERR